MLRRGVLRWAPLTSKGKAARERFVAAGRIWRRIGLARAYRAWVDATDSKAHQNAAKAVRAMRKLGLARAWRQWIAVTDTRQQVVAANAIRAMRRLGLAKALRQWVAATDDKAKVNAGKAVKVMRKQGLARAYRQWIAVTDTRQQVVAANAIRAMGRLGLAKALRQWVSVWSDTRQQQMAEKALRAMKQQGLAKGLRKWMEQYEVGRLQKLAANALRMLQNASLAKGLRRWMEEHAAERVHALAANAMRALRNMSLAKGMRAWVAATDDKAKVNAGKAVKVMRKQGLARAYRQWIAVTDTRQQVVAANAIRAMGRLGLAKALRQWVSVWSDTRQQQMAEKALRAMKQQGLAKGLRKWMEQYEVGRLQKLAANALRMLQNAGLAKGLRAWVVATNFLTESKKVLTRAVARWRGGQMRVAWREWAATALVTRSLQMLFTGEAAKQRRGQMQEGFAAFCENGGRRSKVHDAIARSLQAWTRQAVHAAFTKLLDLCSNEAVLKERVGRLFFSMRRKSLRFGFGELSAHRLALRVVSVPSATECFRVLPSATECHRVSSSATECHRVTLRVMRIAAAAAAAVARHSTLPLCPHCTQLCAPTASAALAALLPPPQVSSKLGQFNGVGRMGRLRRAWTAIEQASGMTRQARQHARSGAILLRRLQLDDAWVAWTSLRFRGCRARDLAQTSLVLWSGRTLPSVFELWVGRARELRLLWLGLTSHYKVMTTEVFRLIKRRAQAHAAAVRALRRALAFWRGTKHAIGLYLWRRRFQVAVEQRERERTAKAHARRAALRQVIALDCP